MKLWIWMIATLASLPISNYLVKYQGYTRNKAILVSVGVVWATVILITLFTLE